MTADEIRAAAIKLVERTTAAHEVPRYVEDERVLRRVAAMLDQRDEAPAHDRGPELGGASAMSRRTRSKGTPDDRASGATHDRHR